MLDMAGYKVLAVVGPDQKGPLKPVALFLQGQLNSQQLPVPNFIVPLGREEWPREEGAGVELQVAGRWDRMAPTPTSEASTSTTNCLSDSGGWEKMVNGPRSPQNPFQQRGTTKKDK